MKCTAWVTMLRNHTWFTGGLRYISGYDKSGTFLKKQHWVAEMSTDDRQSEACNRATILGQDSESYSEIHRAIKLFTDTK